MTPFERRLTYAYYCRRWHADEWTFCVVAVLIAVAAVLVCL